MEALIGVKGRDFVLVSAETSVMNSYLVIKRGDDKFSSLGNIAMTYNGDQGDAFRTAKFVVEDLKYQQIENNLNVTPKVVSTSIQNRIYNQLRRNPLRCSFLVGGVAHYTPELLAVDAYGGMFSEKFIALGMGTYFCYGVLDNIYREDMSIEEALEMIKSCYGVLKNRCAMNIESVVVKVITSTGIEEVTIKL
ncbi:putative proteasome subunit beta type-4 [Nosema granulosis]|uniref:Proteasome subunit beta type-4 n=1 Tax=Nosema granulosis TaxID=83296 RepID=A0A9P6L0P4_9MICR|nr:putative proteasome subunit beta type-4 [Nosema granulosis]